MNNKISKVNVMQTAKKLRKELISLLEANKNIIDGRSVSKYYEIAYTSKGDKIKNY